MQLRNSKGQKIGNCTLHHEAPDQRCSSYGKILNCIKHISRRQVAENTTAMASLQTKHSKKRQHCHRCNREATCKTGGGGRLMPCFSHVGLSGMAFGKIFGEGRTNWKFFAGGISKTGSWGEQRMEIWYVCRCVCNDFVNPAIFSVAMAGLLHVPSPNPNQARLHMHAQHATQPGCQLMFVGSMKVMAQMLTAWSFTNHVSACHCP